MSVTAASAHPLDQVADWLKAGAGRGQPADQVIETHIGKVFLIGDRAYKLKKAVDLGYLDFSTAERREEALRRELALNRATAPDVYLAVRRVVQAADGTLRFAEEGAALEAVLEMRRFDPLSVLANQPEAVSGDFAEDLGRRIADFHAQAPLRPHGGGATLDYVIASNAKHLRALPALAGPDAEALIARTQAAFETLVPLLERRRAEGFARRCHGDLHLGNIFVEQGHAVLFDCIEFNDRLAEIDVGYDLAFLLMDLAFQGQAAGANRLLGAYLDQAARTFGEAVFDGLAALPLFLSVRATVRAHVSAQMGQAALARRYRTAAMEHLDAPAPSLVAVGGLSGTGKSRVSRVVAPQLGACPGAVILRSDEIRKRLWGADALERLPAAAYAPEESCRVYVHMLEAAERCLRAGRAVILDAVFLRPDERAAAAHLARACAVPFAGFWMEAPPEVLRARVAARTGDASDADVGVLNAQFGRDPGVLTWTRLDATQEAETRAQAMLEAMGKV